MRYTGFIIIISIVGSILLAIILIFPHVRELSSLSSELSQNKEDLQNQQKYVAQMAITEEQLKEKQEIIDKVDSALPSGPAIPSLLNFLQETSKSSGITLEGATWEEDASSNAQEKIKEYSLGLNFSGSYFAFKNFLTALEQSARLIDVWKIDFSVPSEQNKPIPGKIDLKIHSY